MIRGLYTAATGMIAQTIKQDVIANNIANAQTPGFKRQQAVEVSFQQALQNSTASLPIGKKPDYPDTQVSSVLVRVQSSIDQTEGSIIETGNDFDMRINGPGSFEISSAAGTYRTRAGNFTLSADRELITQDGSKVMGERGIIKIPEGKIELLSDGSIQADSSVIDKLKIVGADQTATSLVQGSLEGSNVSIIKEMVSMITNLRTYEANQKVVSSIDESLGKLISEAGRF